MILSIGHAVLCFSAVVFVLSSSPGAELSGVGIFLLGLPWTLVFTGIILAVGSSSAWLFALAFGASCLFNTWLLFRLARRRGQ